MAKKLYIIGNGFDLAHKLGSSYYDFHDWLNGTNYVQDNPSDDGNFLSIIDEILVFAGDKKYDSWRDFENALGEIDVESYLNSIASQYDPDIEEMGDLADYVYSNVDIFSAQLGLGNVRERFAEWARTIPVYNDCTPVYEDNIDKNGLFLTFNYTDTLEKVYHINPNNILHVHGSASKAGSPIIVGHKKTYDANKLKEWEKKVFGKDAGIATLIVRALNSLRKDTKTIISKHKKWFDDLQVSGIEEVHLYGLSFGEVDDEYYKKIHEVLPNAKWIFAVYKPKRYGVKNISAFIKRIGIDKSLCSAFDQDTLDKNEVAL